MPSGSAVTADLRCSTSPERYGDHGPAERRHEVGELRDARLVRTPTEAHVHRASICSTSPPSSVPGSSMRAMFSPSAVTAASAPATSGRRVERAGPGQDREVVDDHDRVLDEHRVRAVVGGLHFVNGIPGVAERGHVGRRAASTAQRHVDDGALDVRDDAVREPRAGPAYEGDSRWYPRNASCPTRSVPENEAWPGRDTAARS